MTSAPGSMSFHPPGQAVGPWTKHPTVLMNQTPNPGTGEELVPHIEVIDGDNAGEDCVVYLDWWTMGVSRFSRTDNQV
jgi:hypothetical protein